MTMGADSHRLLTLSDLRTVYRPPSDGAVAKEIDRIDPHCARFIALSPFVCVGTAKAGRADVSPRGGEPGFVHVLDAHRLAMPDRPGNNRLDTLVNLLSEPAIGLLFLIPGFEDTLRVNGRASISTAPDLMSRFVAEGRPPRAVILVDVLEAQLHCGKAIRRAGLWDPAEQVDRSSFASPGEILRDHCRLEVSAAQIDAFVANDARDNLY